MPNTVRPATVRAVASPSGEHCTATASTPPGRREAADRRGATPRAVPLTRNASESPGSPSAAARATSGSSTACSSRSTTQQRVEQAVAGDGGEFAHAADARRDAVVAPARHHERDRPRVADGTGADGGCGTDGELELRIVHVRAGLEVEQHHQAAPPGLLELAHHERAGLRRALPVDESAVVAGDVLAKGVEGDVARREVARRRSLEVADEARAEGRDGDGARVHVQVDGLRPDDLAPHQAHRGRPARFVSSS